MKLSGVPGGALPDDDALARFSAFVANQKPADTPWQPVTDYSFEARKAIEGPHPQLIKDVFAPTSIMDAGCGPGHLVRMLQDVGCERVRGFDKCGKEVGGWGVSAGVLGDDLTNPSLLDDRWHPGYSDLVICREVLEHLTVRELVQAVRNLVGLSRKYVYVTTRFHPAPDHLLDVQDHDDLDPTHITLLNKDFLRLLFVLEGCTQRADLEQKMDHKGLGRVLVYEVGK